MGQSEKTGNLFMALSKAQGEMEGAKKDSHNLFFKSKYADLHECISAARPSLTKNELAVVQTTDVDDRGYWIITILGHSSGEWISGKLLMKIKKDDNQAIGDAITYGRRYSFAAIVGLAQMDDDGNSNQDKGGKDEKKDKGKQPHQPANDNAASAPNTDDTDKRGASYWIIQADKAAKTASSLSRWFAAVTPEAQKTMPADQWKKMESYVTQLLDSLDGTSPEEKKALAGWLVYLKSITNIDVLTVEYESRIQPILKEFLPVNQEKLENCRREVAAKLMGEK